MCRDGTEVEDCHSVLLQQLLLTDPAFYGTTAFLPFAY
jgi:hypothetical protein